MQKAEEAHLPLAFPPSLQDFFFSLSCKEESFKNLKRKAVRVNCFLEIERKSVFIPLKLNAFCVNENKKQNDEQRKEKANQRENLMRNEKNTRSSFFSDNIHPSPACCPFDFSEAASHVFKENGKLVNSLLQNEEEFAKLCCPLRFSDVSPSKSFSAQSTNVKSQDEEENAEFFFSAKIFYFLVLYHLKIPLHLQRLSLNGIELAQHRTISLSFLNHGFSSFCTSSSPPSSEVSSPISPTASPCVSFIVIKVSYRMAGGKGGFGAMLRGQKGKKKKTTNFDSCRDLNGRRIRNANALQRLKQWLEKKNQENLIIDALNQPNLPNEHSNFANTPSRSYKDYNDEFKLHSKYVQDINQRSAHFKNIWEVAMQQNSAKKKELEDKLKNLDNALIEEEKINKARKTKLLNNTEKENSTEEMESSDDDQDMNIFYTSTIKHTHPSLDTFFLREEKSNQIKTTEETKKEEKRASRRQDKETDIEQEKKSYTNQEKEPNTEQEALLENGSFFLCNANDKNEEKEKFLEEAKNLDVKKFQNWEILFKEVHPEVIKLKLQQMNMKCGGYPNERAERLFKYFGMKSSDIPKKLLAKNVNKNNIKI